MLRKMLRRGRKLSKSYRMFILKYCAHPHRDARAQRIHVKSELDDDVLLYPTPDAGTPAEDLTLQYPASDAGTPEESASATKSGTKRKNKKGRSIEERKKALEEDTRCTDVRPHEVFCLGCKRWIQLYQNVTYIESNWSRHAERCFARKEYVLRLSLSIFNTGAYLRLSDVPKISPALPHLRPRHPCLHLFRRCKHRRARPRSQRRKKGVIRICVATSVSKRLSRIVYCVAYATNGLNSEHIVNTMVGYGVRISPLVHRDSRTFPYD